MFQFTAEQEKILNHRLARRQNHSLGYSSDDTFDLMTVCRIKCDVKDYDADRCAKELRLIEIGDHFDAALSWVQDWAFWRGYTDGLDLEQVLALLRGGENHQSFEGAKNNYERLNLGEYRGLTPSAAFSLDFTAAQMQFAGVQ